MPDPLIPVIPDDWTVWAFSDAHGVTSALLQALQTACIIDTARHWIAPPRTALVGCGDYLDRGLDVPGLLGLLRRLETDAAAAGGRVLLARGNHEAMPLMIRDGAHEWLDTWLAYGGGATLAAFDCREPEAGAASATIGRRPEVPSRSVERRTEGPSGTIGRRTEAASGTIERLARGAPWLFGWLENLPQAVRWRDVLFVHGGLPPGGRLADLGIRTDEHLWIRSGFFHTPWDDGAFAGYEAAGIERVVFGHTPQWSGPALFHEGRSLGIDTNAVGDPRMPPGAVQELTLLGLFGDGSFEGARLVRIATADAPDRMRQ